MIAMNVSARKEKKIRSGSTEAKRNRLLNRPPMRSRNVNSMAAGSVWFISTYVGKNGICRDRGQNLHEEGLSRNRMPVD